MNRYLLNLQIECLYSHCLYSFILVTSIMNMIQSILGIISKFQNGLAYVCMCKFLP